MQASLNLQNITKTLTRKNLFKDFSYDFSLGTYCIVGVNGSGKSTLLMLMAGILPYDNGAIQINGIDLMKAPVIAKQQFSYIPDKNIIFPFVKGREFIRFILTIKKAEMGVDAVELMKKFNLFSYMDFPFSEMSLGTQKKFMIIAAIIGNPSILIMDEPTNALENTANEAFLQYLLKHKKSKLIIIASHDQQLINNLASEKLLLDGFPIEKFHNL